MAPVGPGGPGPGDVPWGQYFPGALVAARAHWWFFLALAPPSIPSLGVTPGWRLAGNAR